MYNTVKMYEALKQLDDVRREAMNSYADMDSYGVATVANALHRLADTFGEIAHDEHACETDAAFVEVA